MNDEEQTLVAWIQAHLAIVLGAGGRGGTGIYMDLEDGRLAALTARHVVVNCILTGELTVGSLNGPRLQSLVPQEIRIDHSRDAAFLVVARKTHEGEAVPYSESLGSDVEIYERMPVIVSGVIGEWKTPDTKTRHIPKTPILHFFTNVIDPDRNGYVICRVDETSVQIPASFRGMSGGPCVSDDRRILGICIAEYRRRPGTGDGEIKVTRLSHLRPLFKPVHRGLNDLTVHRQVSMDFWAISKETGQRVLASVLAQVLSSRSTPDASQGRTCRIVGMKIVTPPSAEAYIINCYYTFTCSGHTDEDLHQALADEVGLFLMDTDFKLDSPVQFFER